MYSFMYKNNNIFPCYFLNLFTIFHSIPDHLTRRAFKLLIIPRHTNIRAYSTQVYGTKLLNSLSTDINESTSIAKLNKKAENIW